LKIVLYIFNFFILKEQVNLLVWFNYVGFSCSVFSEHFEKSGMIWKLSRDPISLIILLTSYTCSEPQPFLSGSASKNRLPASNKSGIKCNEKRKQ